MVSSHLTENLFYLICVVNASIDISIYFILVFFFLTLQGCNSGPCFTFQQSIYILEEYCKEAVTTLHVCFTFSSRFSKVLHMVIALRERKIELSFSASNHPFLLECLDALEFLLHA